MNFDAFLSGFRGTALEPWLATIEADIEAGLSLKRYGDLPRWLESLHALPELKPSLINLDSDTITVDGPTNETQQQQIEQALRGLHPWRKGPFQVFDTFIDTEWRSDWKWQRLAPHIAPLEGRTVLDVGCGSGYHCWRMRGAGADLVLGIDPTPLFIVQFQALQHFIQDQRVGVLPLGIEHVPAGLKAFDTVFSMGILYHRRSPIDHLLQLRDTLRAGGELVLETLVIDGGPSDCLVPEGRYARMGNVWFLPSTDMLELWLRKTGFKNVRTVDVTTTSTDEQRRTGWMQFHSLAQFINSEQPELTIEGYPAPKRAIVLAEAP
ncbi:tRNA (mo5U34)-methyltransferase [Litorivivens lipolytica]|uniref:tRNA U34 carboxymethyltransferase n=1 Tax=Litorivivens lipolytica TaxID=1524264 RepID=A0A7W4Z560_9GAMM|nr:tRNA (mo5U34)-methyltransferase [Litorivivens lipolytica]